MSEIGPVAKHLEGQTNHREAVRENHVLQRWQGEREASSGGVETAGDLGHWAEYLGVPLAPSCRDSPGCSRAPVKGRRGCSPEDNRD